MCSALEVPKKRNRHIRYYAGGHPLPNEGSFAAARAVLALLKRARANTFVFFLISGGGSAMLELPRDRKVTLDDTIGFHEALVASGATITEINTVAQVFLRSQRRTPRAGRTRGRKTISAAGRRPSQGPGGSCLLPTLPDYSTLAECQEILERFHLLEKFPAAVREYFQKLRQDDATPSKSSPQDALAAFQHAQFDTLLSNHDFVNAARDHAQSLGYKVVIDNTCDDWDYADAARYLLRALS